MANRRQSNDMGDGKMIPTKMIHTARRCGAVLPVLLGLFLLLPTAPALGEGTYMAIFSSAAHPGYTHTLTFDTLDELSSMLQEDPPMGSIPDLDQATDPLNLYINYNGLPMTLSLDEDATDFVLDIPDLGIHEVFSGASRVEAAAEMEEWTTTDPDGVMTQIEAYVTQSNNQAESSSGDIAGCFIMSLP